MMGMEHESVSSREAVLRLGNEADDPTSPGVHGMCLVGAELIRILFPRTDPGFFFCDKQCEFKATTLNFVSPKFYVCLILLSAIRSGLIVAQRFIPTKAE
jgi:hypothetical protein